jgi:hypothetical protein
MIQPTMNTIISQATTSSTNVGGKLSEMIDSINSDGNGIQQTLSSSNNLSPVELLKVNQYLDAYSAKINIASKVSGVVTKDVNELVHIQ